MRATERLTGAYRDTIMRLLEQIGYPSTHAQLRGCVERVECVADRPSEGR